MNFWDKCDLLKRAEACGAHSKILRRIKNNLRKDYFKIDRIVKKAKKQMGANNKNEQQ